MTVLVANTDITSASFLYLVNRVNELAGAISNVAVTTNSNTATGNAAITGWMTAGVHVSGNSTVNASVNATTLFITSVAGNASINSTSVFLTNSTANLNIRIPTSTQISNGSFFLNANGSYTSIIIPYNPISNNTLVTTGAVAQLVDSYLMASFDAVQYMLNVKDNNANNHYTAVILTTHDTANAYITEYADLVTNTSMGTFSANANTTAVRLYFSPVSTNTNVKFTKINL